MKKDIEDLKQKKMSAIEEMRTFDWNCKGIDKNGNPLPSRPHCFCREPSDKSNWAYRTCCRCGCVVALRILER